MPTGASRISRLIGSPTRKSRRCAPRRAAPNIRAEDRYHLCFALGKALEDRARVRRIVPLLRARQRAEEGGDPLQDRSRSSAMPRCRPRCARANFSRRGKATAATRRSDLHRRAAAHRDRRCSSRSSPRTPGSKGTIGAAGDPAPGRRAAGARAGHRQSALSRACSPNLEAGRFRRFGEKYIADTRVYRSRKAAVHRQDAE